MASLLLGVGVKIFLGGPKSGEVYFFPFETKKSFQNPGESMQPMPPHIPMPMVSEANTHWQILVFSLWASSYT